jgi:anaerobic selenocysteine-containing dehydrogenase
MFRATSNPSSKQCINPALGRNQQGRPEASSTFQFWRDLGHRFGFAEIFPCETIEVVLDYRLTPSGKTFEEFSAGNYMYVKPPEFRKYRKTGFTKPSGKVELRSSILEDLGFDPLLYYREGPAVIVDYPYHVFTGVREDAFFQTGQRQIELLRKRSPTPKLFMHLKDAARLVVSRKTRYLTVSRCFYQQRCAAMPR